MRFVARVGNKDPMRSALAVAAVLCGSAAATPLLLTPLLRANKTAEARSASAVTAEGIEMGNSGFFTVPTASGERLNNIFTWFQPCSNGCKPDAPFIMWFQGGPGGPGTFGALAEIGSHYVDEAIKLQKRDYSWCADNNCIFIDQPVQTGFSFQTDKAGAFDPKAIEYTATSPEAMAQALNVLTQFFAIWPEYVYSPLLAMTYECFLLLLLTRSLTHLLVANTLGTLPRPSTSPVNRTPASTRRTSPRSSWRTTPPAPRPRSTCAAWPWVTRS